jgi:hypothetical protein
MGSRLHLFGFRALVGGKSGPVTMVHLLIDMADQAIVLDGKSVWPFLGILF